VLNRKWDAEICKGGFNEKALTGPWCFLQVEWICR